MARFRRTEVEITTFLKPVPRLPFVSVSQDRTLSVLLILTVYRTGRHVSSTCHLSRHVFPSNLVVSAFDWSWICCVIYARLNPIRVFVKSI